MNQSNEQIIKEPIGRVMANIGRLFLSELHVNLSHLDLERAYYPLLLIEKSEGNLTQQELAGKLSCDKVQVVRIINYLSSKGYVKRTPNTSDRRKYKLEITEKARKSLPDIKSALTTVSGKAFTSLSSEKIEELYSILRIIENNLINNKKSNIV